MLGRTSRERAIQVRLVRAELESMHRPHGSYVSDLQVASILSRAGNPGIAADAICMWPRPMWVESIAGPYPATLELANPEDVAGVDEWGAGGVGT